MIESSVDVSSQAANNLLQIQLPVCLGLIQGDNQLTTIQHAVGWSSGRGRVIRGANGVDGNCLFEQTLLQG